jgi:hypothetical protein
VVKKRLAPLQKEEEVVVKKRLAPLQKEEEEEPTDKNRFCLECPFVICKFCFHTQDR